MEIRIQDLVRTYSSEGKQIKALDHVDLTIPANRIFTLLGPSGCGKTTLLRCIVGLEVPDGGEIYIGDELVWSKEKNIFVPPERRGLGMVFQTYAIWPHMNVFDNVAYPLQTQKMAKEEIRRKVAKVLDFVQLSGYENRPATKLSGGQQQRVALARALVAEPKVILFDEPLSNLDAKLREETRKELRSFLTELQITAIYVTHDRVEALALSDLIAVMRSGKIIEINEPKKIYFNSDSQFVADFIGRANLIRGTVEELDGDHAVFASEIGPVRALNSQQIPLGQEAFLCVRPEFIRLAKERKEEQNSYSGKVETLIFIGEAFEGEIRIGETLLTTTVEPTADFREGDSIAVSFDPDHCFLLAS
ncbi:iron(III) transport system ATP-binding protein [Malonomonas rubra DSM 5091]|uniref:Iron(III) transport system ATP-binding protein n=1 Tax=Malonomonas rubra DSM 5091 TaxID=1122189 RepID=A0A1M6IWZ4_MALRU|nr:ABC transporter ATP-binding protein [Malonomonas rubra]SHJ38894.1 iron(III) transport system ATP-binding protein [Malonomonas rubra DSM 5091]